MFKRRRIEFRKKTHKKLINGNLTNHEIVKIAKTETNNPEPELSSIQGYPVLFAKRSSTRVTF